MRKAVKGQGSLGYIGVGGAVGLPEGAEQAAMEQSAEAARTADVGQLFGGSCTSAGRSVRGAHPGGGGRAGECVSLSCHPPQRRPD